MGNTGFTVPCLSVRLKPSNRFCTWMLQLLHQFPQFKWMNTNYLHGMRFCVLMLLSDSNLPPDL